MFESSGKTMYLLLVIVLLGTSVRGQDINTPPFCNICKCVNDSNNNFAVTCTTDIKNFVFENSSWIDPTTNQTYSYVKLTVENTRILTLDKQFLASNLTYLNLANNSIVNISSSIFSNLQQMETLILTYNNIEVIHPDAFDGQYLEGDFRPLRSLKTLRLDHNRLHSLDSDIFEHTSRLEVLSLSHNPFKTLDTQIHTAITSLVYLKELDLSYTELASLPDHFLHTPSYLSLLDLSGNAFDTIPVTLGDSRALKTLYFNNNPIVNLTKLNGFPNVPTLEILHMNNMRNLTNVTEGALSKLNNLTELYMFDNPKLAHFDKAALSERLEDAVYATWPPITKLYLQNNKLTHLDQEIILSWTALTELDLTYNSWTCECENQWMIDELMPVYLKLDQPKAKYLKCAAPIEMAQLTFYDVYVKQSSMRCLDLYGHRPERDGAMLVGILLGVLITIPLILFIIYSYQRHWFGLFDGSPASYSRQFYKRTVSSDDYF